MKPYNEIRTGSDTEVLWGIAAGILLAILVIRDVAQRLVEKFFG